MVEPNEDLSSLDDSQSFDIPSETNESDVSDEVQSHSCFGMSDPPSTLCKPITTAAQNPDESLEEWADRIRALKLDGFPEVTDTLVEKLAM